MVWLCWQWRGEVERACKTPSPTISRTVHAALELGDLLSVLRKRPALGPGQVWWWWYVDGVHSAVGAILNRDNSEHSTTAAAVIGPSESPCR